MFGIHRKERVSDFPFVTIPVISRCGGSLFVGHPWGTESVMAQRPVSGCSHPEAQGNHISFKGLKAHQLTGRDRPYNSCSPTNLLHLFICFIFFFLFQDQKGDTLKNTPRKKVSIQTFIKARRAELLISRWFRCGHWVQPQRHVPASAMMESQLCYPSSFPLMKTVGSSRRCLKHLHPMGEDWDCTPDSWLLPGSALTLIWKWDSGWKIWSKHLYPCLSSKQINELMSNF